MNNTAKPTPSFFVIGAQKSGTTSLYHYLTEHPDVFLPTVKEINFFSNDEEFKKGPEWFLDTWFSELPRDKVGGEVSSKYYASKDACQRIHDLNPDAKLIAILRNPVDRAYSHYRMAVKHARVEDNTFEEHVDKLIDKSRSGNTDVDEWTDYLAFGEYGKSLSYYLETFSREQILILFMEEMERDGKTTMDRIYEFIGMKSFESEVYETKFHQGGDARFPFLKKALNFVTDTILKRQIVQDILFKIFPKEMLHNLFWKFSEFNSKPGDNTLSRDLRQKLSAYYADDVKLLEKKFSVMSPWPDFK